MIEKREVDGRPATVMYLTDAFEPAPSVDEASLVRVLFDDGSGLWLTPAKKHEEST